MEGGREDQGREEGWEGERRELRSRKNDLVGQSTPVMM